MARQKTTGHFGELNRIGVSKTCMVFWLKGLTHRANLREIAGSKVRDRRARQTGIDMARIDCVIRRKNARSERIADPEYPMNLKSPPPLSSSRF